MTEKYTGTRDTTIEENTWGGLHVSHWRAGGAVLGIEIVDDLREYFLAERDRELGLWRWPENPEYVVVQTRKDRVRVLNEQTLNVNDVIRDTNPARRDASPEAARAYFDAHPEKKPWHDAQQNDVWALQLKGCYEPELYRFAQDTTCADSKVFRPVNNPARVFFEANSPMIESAEKVWPQSKES